MPVEVEGDEAVEVGAVDMDSGGFEAGENVGFGQAVGCVEADGDHGESGFRCRQNFRRGGCGAAVMAYF